MRTLFYNALVVTMVDGIEPFRGYVVIKDGVIEQAAKGEYSGPAPDVKENLKGAVLMPGWIHAHIHLCQTLFRGLAERRTLFPWLSERILPLEAAHNESSMYASARAGLIDLIKSGCATVCDMGSVRHTDSLFRAAAESGLRYIGGKTYIDKGDFVPPSMLEYKEEALDITNKLYEQWHGKKDGRLMLQIAPRFVPACSSVLLTSLIDFAEKHDLLLHTHAAENNDEVDFVKRETGEKNIGALDKVGFLGKKTLLVHCVKIDEQEADIIAERGTAVCHCPGANTKLGSGIAPLKILEHKGIPTAVGSDGAACNNRLDMFEEIRLAARLQSLVRPPSEIDPKQMLKKATIEGATALGIDKITGSISPGKQADIIVLTPSWETDEATVLTDILWRATSSDLQAVYVNGVKIFESGKVLTMDEDIVKSSAADERHKLLKRAGVK